MQESSESCSEILKNGYADCGIGGRRLLIRLSVFIPTILLIILTILSAVTEDSAEVTSDLLGGSCDQLKSEIPTEAPIAAVSEPFGNESQAQQAIFGINNNKEEESNRKSCFQRRFPEVFTKLIYTATVMAVFLCSLPVIIMFPPYINWETVYDGSKYVKEGKDSWIEAQAQAGYDTDRFPTLPRVIPQKNVVYDNTFWIDHYQFMEPDSNPLKNSTSTILQKYSDPNFKIDPNADIPMPKGIWSDIKEKNMFMERLLELDVLNSQKINKDVLRDILKKQQARKNQFESYKTKLEGAIKKDRSTFEKMKPKYEGKKKTKLYTTLQNRIPALDTKIKKTGQEINALNTSIGKLKTQVTKPEFGSKKKKRKFGSETEKSRVKPLWDKDDPGELNDYIRFMPCEYRPEFSCDLHRMKAEPKVAEEIAGKYFKNADGTPDTNAINKLKKLLENEKIPEDVWKECEWNDGKNITNWYKKNGCVDKKTITSWNNCELCYNKVTSCSSEKRGYASAAMMFFLSICLLGFGIPIWIWYFDAETQEGKALFGNKNSTRTIDESLEIKYDENGNFIEVSKGDPDITTSKKLNDGVWAWIAGFCIIVGILTFLSAIVIVLISYTCPRGSGWYEGASVGTWSFLRPFTQF